MNEPRDPSAPSVYAEWWLATLGRTVVWARLRVREAGTAEVLDSDGNTLSYDSEDSARAALLDAEFVGSTQDTKGDFAPVGNQDFPEHLSCLRPGESGTGSDRTRPGPRS